MSTLLRINMSTQEITKEELPDKWKRFGGRALTDAIAYDEIPAKADALGPENKLIIAPGFLSGTITANTGRVSFGAKSPLTRGIKESNSGGQLAHSIARLGYAAVVIEGEPEDKSARYVLVLEADGTVNIERNDDLAFKQVFETSDILAQSRPEGDRFAISVVGPAGEYGSTAAGIACTDTHMLPLRFAGRGGLGAVMAAKGLKGIIVSDKGLRNRSAADPDRYKAAVKVFGDALRNDKLAQGLGHYGTNLMMNILNEAGGLPTKNYRGGRWEFANDVGGETQRELTEQRSKTPEEAKWNTSHGCSSGCIIKCSRYWLDKDGEIVTKGPEYESAWAFGPDCLIDSLDDIGNLDRACAEIGLDTIDAGNALAVYMESGAIEFGDGPGALQALKAGLEDPEMRFLWDGAAATGKKCGITHVPVVKNQALPAYDPRALKGMGVTYATTPMGADHTAGYATAHNVVGTQRDGRIDGHKKEGQVKLSRYLQILTGMLDAVGICHFGTFAVIEDPTAIPAIVEMLSGFTGFEWTEQDLDELGEDTMTLERLFNNREGFTAADDRLPEFMYTEELDTNGLTFDITDAELEEVFDYVPASAKRMGLLT